MESLNTGKDISVRGQTIAKVDFGESNLSVSDPVQSIFDHKGAMRINFLEDAYTEESVVDHISDALSDNQLVEDCKFRKAFAALAKIDMTTPFIDPLDFELQYSYTTKVSQK